MEESLSGLLPEGLAALASARINRFERLRAADRESLGAWEEALGSVTFEP